MHVLSADEDVAGIFVVAAAVMADNVGLRARE